MTRTRICIVIRISGGHLSSRRRSDRADSSPLLDESCLDHLHRLVVGGHQDRVKRVVVFDGGQFSVPWYLQHTSIRMDRGREVASISFMHATEI